MGHLLYSAASGSYDYTWCPGLLLLRVGWQSRLIDTSVTRFGVFLRHEPDVQIKGFLLNVYPRYSRLARSFY